MVGISLFFYYYTKVLERLARGYMISLYSSQKSVTFINPNSKITYFRTLCFCLHMFIVRIYISDRYCSLTDSIILFTKDKTIMKFKYILSLLCGTIDEG